ncbi:M20/M25/M40 family metallo-hydrolase [Corynebacterium sp. zg254]|uniref:dipeptidase n=1 Tax=Corynebacterium sp. zg254 TaxID=2656645 RepID=UPI00215126C6|nr:dipeptidase [Corynebacterium sp. zg254]MCR5914809.1 M20/M25/M40 family metallo-hydrolase [Corynebacterium sp. zg254]
MNNTPQTNNQTNTQPHQPLSPERARELITQRMPELKKNLSELVAFHSIHSVPELQEHNDGAATWTIEHFTAAGVPVHGHTTTDGSTSVIGVRDAAPGYPTVMLYSHFDVQPAGVESEWTSDPWTLSERDGRWYGRGTADCKGHVAMHLAVLDAMNALIEEGHEELAKIGIRVVVEGSEERGGYGLEDLLESNPELFQADTFLIADSGNDELGVPSVCTALRGSATLTLTVDTINQPMHSGQFGGAAPDALLELIRIISTFHDADGLVAIDGLTPTERWEGTGPDAATFCRNAGTVDGVSMLGASRGFAPNDLTVMNPSITVTGLDSLSVEDAINAVPGRAAAHVSLRVPPGREPQECLELLIAHINKVGAQTHGRVSIERGSLAEPFRADTSGPALAELTGALSDSYGKPAVEVASGGSIPLTNKLLAHYPDAELALFGIEEPTCRIHSADESVHPDEIRDIAVAELLFMARTAARVRESGAGAEA